MRPKQKEELHLKIAVIGAGAMGSMLGASLTAGGADVTLIVRRPEVCEALNKKGLTIKQYAGNEPTELHIPVKAALKTDGLGVMDAVLVMVKGPDTEAAMLSALPLIDEHTRVITLQNGIGNTEIIEKTVAPQNVFYGCLNLSAIVEAPGVLTGSAFGKVNVYLGAVEKGEAQKAFGESLCALFARGMLRAEYTENIDYEVWSKLLINIAVNASCGLVRLRGGEAGEDQNFVMLAVDMVKEAIDVAKACGVELDLGTFLTRTLPSARKHSGAHYPSMAQDMLIAKVPTEIDFINGAVERLGERFGIPTPVNTTVCRLVRTIEHNYDKQYVEKAAKTGPSFEIVINDKFCKGCGYCVKYCPKNVLKLNDTLSGKGYRTAAVADKKSCIGCASCAVICPEAAIEIRRED